MLECCRGDGGVGLAGGRGAARHLPAGGGGGAAGGGELPCDPGPGLSGWRAGPGAGAGLQHHPAPLRQAVQRPPTVVGIEEFLEPLQELEIVLKAAFDEAVNRHHLHSNIEHLSRGQGAPFSTPSFVKATLTNWKFCMYSCSSIVLNFTRLSGTEPTHRTKQLLSVKVWYLEF